MKTINPVFSLIILLIFVSGCKKPDLQTEVPSCIEDEIRQIMKEGVRNPPARVEQWKVDNKTYYYITSDCCDQYNLLYDESCNVVCAPDGGFTGSGDGNCPEFIEPVEKTLVWEDDRN